MHNPHAPDAFPAVPTLETAPTAPGALAAEARRIHAESVRYWSAYPLDAFFRRPGPDVWAPADQVRHLSKSGVKLGLVGGATLPDPHGLLEGSGKVHRYVPLASADDAARPGVRALLASALAARARARGKPVAPPDEKE